jgi:hypothetical protein
MLHVCYTEIVPIAVPLLMIVFCPTRYFTRQGLILSAVHIMYIELRLTLLRALSLLMRYSLEVKFQQV